MSCLQCVEPRVAKRHFMPSLVAKVPEGVEGSLTPNPTMH